jgi:plasmid stabilization system protein ParE
MDFAVVWTKSATEQLERILRHIAADRPVAAAEFRAEILERVESLSRLPLIGAVYEKDCTGRTREILSGNYRVFYRVNEPARRV